MDVNADLTSLGQQNQHSKENKTETPSNNLEDPNTPLKVVTTTIPKAQLKVVKTTITSGSGRSSAKPKKNPRGRQKKNLPLPAIQVLFDTCQEVLVSTGNEFGPTPDNVERLRLILDGMTPEDVAVFPDSPFFFSIPPNNEPSIVGYQKVYECSEFSIGIFCLPMGSSIPLHDHPGMTVFSKLLFGTMHVKSYDWVIDDDHSDEESNFRLAKIKADRDFNSPCNTSILYPKDAGNIHCFTAITPCAVLDVLTPPYGSPESRHCTYYMDRGYINFVKESPESVQNEDRLAWLVKREAEPSDFKLVGLEYEGPNIVMK